jgi:hypothetical protein
MLHTGTTGFEFGVFVENIFPTFDFEGWGYGGTK